MSETTDDIPGQHRRRGPARDTKGCGCDQTDHHFARFFLPDDAEPVERHEREMRGADVKHARVCLHCEEWQPAVGRPSLAARD